MKPDLRGLFGSFLAEGSFEKAETFGSGHIHDTFLITTKEKEKDDYILQRLNSNIFRRIPELQENIERVTNHIRGKLLNIPGADLKRECVNMIRARNGKSWITDEEGNSWRLLVFITNHRSYDIVDSPALAYEGGRAVGRFQAMLADMPEPPLHETIPDFHNTEKRLEWFWNAVALDKVKRAAKLESEIEFVRERAETMTVIRRLGSEGSIPLRITHNDTKFNNILLDENDRALCIIDLDTVMPGYVHYDFGDAIRTAANVAAEDEQDLSRIRMDINLFKAYAEGYLSETRDTLNAVEKEYLAFAPILITFVQAVRFLTDYLDGDNYYRIHHEHHNLQRTRAQIRLVESMEEQYCRMQEIIARSA